MYTTYYYILNPETSKYVKKDSVRGKELIKKFPDHENYMEIDLEPSQIEDYNPLSVTIKEQLKEKIIKEQLNKTGLKSR